MAQTKAPAPLLPAAQEALNKGIIAAKVPDYLLAVRFFEEARKLAPEAPVIYLNPGLAESRIPGRELRAIAWFGAYLAAYADAPNAAAVKEQVAVLDVRNQSKVSRLIKSVQDAASQMSSSYDRDHLLDQAARLWAEANDLSSALKTAELISAPNRVQGLPYIAEIRVKVGDIAGSQKTLTIALAIIDRIDGDRIDGVHIDGAYLKALVLTKIAAVQTQAGDITGAQKTFLSAKMHADLIDLTDAFRKSTAQIDIAEAQAEAGDIAGAQETLASAQKTVALMQDASFKSSAQGYIALAKAGITNAPKSTRQSTSNTQPPIRPAITVSDWLEKLDNDNESNDCPLNTGPFLDLAGYMKSLPPSDNPQSVFERLRETAQNIIEAQNVIIGMLV